MSGQSPTGRETFSLLPAAAGSPSRSESTPSLSGEEAQVLEAVAISVSRPPAAVVVTVGIATRAVEAGEQTGPSAAEADSDSETLMGEEEEEEAETDSSGSSSSGGAATRSSFLTPGCDQGIGKVLEDLRKAEEANRREWEERGRARVEREEEVRRLTGRFFPFSLFV